MRNEAEYNLIGNIQLSLCYEQKMRWYLQCNITKEPRILFPLVAYEAFVLGKKAIQYLRLNSTAASSLKDIVFPC
jgi:hypothetical protein